MRFFNIQLCLLAAVGMTSTIQAFSETRFIQLPASNKEERSAIANLGVSIEFTRSDSVWGFASPAALAKVQKAGIPVLSNNEASVGRGGHEGPFDFPTADAKYHNFAETTAAMNAMQTKNSDIVRVVSIGKSGEGRDLLAIHINTTAQALADGKSSKPGAIYMGAHHAREHLSVEVPLMFAQYLLDNRKDTTVSALLDTRDIWIIPMVNPDGAEYDIAKGKYMMWRKNRRNNGDGEYGVDLNRNYGYEWGTGGSSNDTSDETYMGPSAFSEPETQAIKAFVDGQPNAKVLLTFHTYSELVLYPWGHTFDPVSNGKDLKVFEKMATTMAAWNHYTPEQASALYIASGDTCDWAYGTHGIFAFTFEMSPNGDSPNGFYPGAKMIDQAFNDNLKPSLYMLDVADDPYKVLNTQPTGFLQNYVEPSIDYHLFFE